MRKVGFLLFVLSSFLFCIDCNAQNYDFVDNGFYYRVYSIENMEVELVKGENEYKGDILIPLSVNYKGKDFSVAVIGEKAFESAPVTSVDFGNVRIIGNEAFSYCENLVSLDFKNVTDIGFAAFSHCSNVVSINWGAVKNIGNCAFIGCNGISSLEFNGMDLIGDDSFNGCNGLKSVKFNDVEDIRFRAFGSCKNLTDVDLGNTKFLRSCIFCYCDNLKNVNLGGVESLQMYTFADCLSLEFIDLKNVKYIDKLTFSNCPNLKTVDLKNAENIIAEAFVGDKGISSVSTSLMSPGKLSENAFEQTIFMDATLRVPAGCKSAYESAPGWKNFFSIVEEDATEGLFPLTVNCGKGGSVCFGDFEVSDGIRTEMFKNGVNVSVSLIPDNGYRVKSVVVNDIDVTDMVVENSYSVLMDRNNVINVLFEEIPVYLSVQQADKGCSKIRVARNSNVEVVIIPNDGWSINSVTFNGNDVTSELDAENRYTTPCMMESAILNVTYEMNIPTIVSEAASSTISVSGHNGVIMIKGMSPGDVIDIFSNEGANVAHHISSGSDARITVVPNKVYIVKVGNRTFMLAL